MNYLGDFLEDAVVRFPFTTNAADGGRESFSAALEEADIVILKDNVAMTLDASTITITTDLGSRVGVHTVAVDMSNDADFTTGSDYAAILYASDETLDSQAPAGVLAQWSCENRTHLLLTNLHLDHLLAVDYDPAAKPGVGTALLNELVESDAGVSRFTVNALENGPSGSGASAATIADAVWDEAQADHVTAGSFGVIASEIADILTDTGTTLPATLATIDAYLDTEIAAILADTGELQTDWANGGRLDLLIDSIITHLTDIKGATWASGTDSLEAIRDRGDAAWVTGAAAPTAAAIADAVWDETQAAHATAGTFGELATEIANILADTNELQTDDVPGLIAALNDPTAAAIADAVWDETQASHTTAGSFGELATEIAALQADLDNGTDGLGALAALINGLPSTSDMASPAEVATEIADALRVDTISAPTGVPSASPTFAAAIAWLMTLSRNRMTFNKTTGVHTLRNDANTADIATYTGSDDGTTVTRPEWA